MDGDIGAGGAASLTGPGQVVCCRGRQWRVLDHPLVRHALAEFVSGFEDPTLQFFDAALPACRRLIDVGGYFGMLSLYAGDRVDEITLFEPSPSHQAVLRAHLALNPGVGARTTVIQAAVGAAAGEHELFRKGFADSGASLFQVVERQGLLSGACEALVPVVAAATALAQAGLDADTLLKIDIEGAEYEVIPAIAGLLRQSRPFLQLSFHPFNLVAAGDAVATNLLRLRRMVDLVEALRGYDYWYLPMRDGWREVTPEQMPGFLEAYLLQPKAVARIATRQYGFVESMGFARQRLDLPGCRAW